MASKPNHADMNLHATQHSPVMTIRMGFNAAKQCDPIKRAEKDLTSYNPTIGNNGDSLYTHEDFALVVRFKSLDDLERERNKACGLGEKTNGEVQIYQDMYFYTSYYNDTMTSFYDDSSTSFTDERKKYFEENYDPDTWRYDKETYDYYNSNSDWYIEMVENGEIIDDGTSCRMGDMRMGDSLSEEEMDAARQDFGDEAIDAAQQEWDAEAEQEFAEGDPNAPQAIANQQPEPDREHDITSPVKLNFAFSKASKEADPKDEAPQAIVIQPAPVAANDAAFQMTA